MKKMKKETINIIIYVLLFLAGITVCFLRTSYAVMSPVMYTEDGSWISAIIENGLIDTCLTAKGSYLVAGNVLLLYISWWLNLLFFGANLTYLPVFVALVSYVYYVVLAGLPLWLMKNLMDIKARIILYFAILCVPMGTSISEVYGRISNIGYGCFFIAFILMLYLFLEKNSKHSIKTAGAYAGLLLCCVTNPTCYIILAVVLLWNMWKDFRVYGFKLVLKWEGILIFITGILACISLILMYLNKHMEIGQESVEIVSGGLIEYFFRALAFVFMWPFYCSMNDIWAVVILILMIGFFAFSFWMVKDKTYRILLALSYGATIFYTVITLFMRKTLTSQLSGYTTTFPDRYFYVQELLVLLDFCIILSAVFQKKISNKVWDKIVLGIFGVAVLVNVFHLKQIFELNHSQYIDCSVTFAEMVESAYDAQGEQESYNVEIPIPGFSMELPAKYVKATVEYNRGGS